MSSAVTPGRGVRAIAQANRALAEIRARTVIDAEQAAEHRAHSRRLRDLLSSW